jgi:hypothetical protein
MSTLRKLKAVSCTQQTGISVRLSVSTQRAYKQTLTTKFPHVSENYPKGLPLKNSFFIAAYSLVGIALAIQFSASRSGSLS